MREHLYRAQRVDNKEWVCGDLIENQGDYYIYPFENRSCYTESKCYEPYERMRIKAIKVIPETVGEYTGLTDKNGKKIFEHDVCRIDGHSYTYEVVFEHSHWAFRILSDKVYCYPWFDSHCGERCEVIGTIFDEVEME